MSSKHNLPVIILLVAAGVGAVVSIGLWIALKQLTIYTTLSLIGAAVCAAIALYLQPQAIRKVTDMRQAQYGSNAVVMSVLLAAILLVLNMILNPSWPRPDWLKWLPTFQHQWDLTASRQYTLSAETINILKSINQDVEILAFYSSNSSETRSKDRLLLENYARQNSHIKIQWLDPVAQPALAQEYGVAYDGTIIVKMGERRQEVTYASEQNLTTAFIKVIQARQPVVYFTTGHGECALDDYTAEGYSQIKSALESSNYQVRTLATAITTTIPADASAVVIVGPMQNFSTGEAAMLRAYLERGGSLMLILDMADPEKQPDPNYGLGDLMDEWGITLRNDVVADAQQSLALNMNRIYIAPVVTEYGYSPITKNLNGRTTAFIQTRSISQTRTITDVRYVELAKSSANSWGVSDLAEVQDALNTYRAPQPGPHDAHGPLTLAASLENSKTSAKMIVFGGSSFASNRWVNSTAARDLFLNAANWLSAEEGEEFQLPPKQNPTVRTLEPFTLDKLIGAVVTSLCLPILVVAGAGVYVWWRRR